MITELTWAEQEEPGGGRIKGRVFHVNATA